MRQARFLLPLLAAGYLVISAAPGDARSQEATCLGETATIVGTPGPDRLRGTPGRDVIQALGGNDLVYGLGGDDLICGDTGKDRLFGGDGDDTLQKESGGGLMSGGRGADRLFGNLGDDVLYGGPGNDSMQGGTSDEEDFSPGKDTMYGGPGQDFANGGLGDDRIYGGPGNDDLESGGGLFSDRVSGGPGDDTVTGSDGDDTLTGGPGNDHLEGGAGDDLLRGGPGDDFLNGGPGDDRLDGGPGRNVLVDDTLASLIAFGTRQEIRDWATARTVGQIDADVAALTAAERDQLAELLLDTNATGEARDKLLRVMRRALAVRELGFYAEVWSYTFVEIVPPGFFGGCNHVFLDPDAWGGLSDQDTWNVFLHESFHSFNCVNGGPAGALDEGSAIWVTFAPFAAPLIPGQSLAETTYGTKLYYRDLNGQPDYPLTAPLSPTQKLLDVYAYLSAHDPSRLPWNSTERLQACFVRYFVDLNRNVDFFNVWLPAVEQRTNLMLADPGCKPL
jgi:hypothetical protein